MISQCTHSLLLGIKSTNIFIILESFVYLSESLLEGKGVEGRESERYERSKQKEGVGRERGRGREREGGRERTRDTEREGERKCTGVRRTYRNFGRHFPFGLAS